MRVIASVIHVKSRSRKLIHPFPERFGQLLQFINQYVYVLSYVNAKEEEEESHREKEGKKRKDVRTMNKENTGVSSATPLYQ